MDQSTTNFIYFLAIIGGIVFIIWISKILWALIVLILPNKNYLERYGRDSWAVVTGGSDGLGLGFCQELAEIGFNICIIARNKNKMEAALEKLRYLHEEREIKTKYIVADFVDSPKEGFFARILEQLQGLDVSILVNNVGVSNIGYFHEIPEQRLWNEININVLPMTFLSYGLVPVLLGRDRRSAIINVSSVAAENPVPFISTYSATKAYNDCFSQSIQMEYADKIDVISLRPMYVESNMSKKEKSCTVASSNQCARATLSYLGIDYETNGYCMHRFLSYLTSFMPKPILRCVAESESRQIMEEEQAGGANL